MPKSGRRTVILAIIACILVTISINIIWLSSNNWQDAVQHLHIPDRVKAVVPSLPTEIPMLSNLKDKVSSTIGPPVILQAPKGSISHTISTLMNDADKAWTRYQSGRSTTFRRTVATYRKRYGRHPPPGFQHWYKFARVRNVTNIDDFDQIMDDLRPFWAIDPVIIRTHAAHMWEADGHGVAGIHIRNRGIARISRKGWRSTTMANMIRPFVEFLPDMDIAMNRLDQPRVIIPWQDMQAFLLRENTTRSLPTRANNSFTPDQAALLDLDLDPDHDKSERLDAHWFSVAGKQYMKIAAKACPPGSPARNSSIAVEDIQQLYKEPVSGYVNNFNMSSDLCTVGNQLAYNHGLLFASSSMMASHQLVPIFGECKVNVNSDILFPANKYYQDDKRYTYDGSEDKPWADKVDKLFWRGATAGGVSNKDNWHTMHRQRLVQLLNGTYMALNGTQVSVLTQTDEDGYNQLSNLSAQSFAQAHTDVAFVLARDCDPSDCSFYNDVFEMLPSVPMKTQFHYKYLIDIDGMSFSGRWHAFLQSRSLGFKATIFREWHDSRLFAWRHFVPVDNLYDDIYGLLTYFIGYDDSARNNTASGKSYENPSIHIASHQAEAQNIAEQSRDWASRVLRKEDIEIYMFRLLLEYARVSDDAREDIGYSGDGSELDAFDGMDAVRAKLSELYDAAWERTKHWFGKSAHTK